MRRCIALLLIAVLSTMPLAGMGKAASTDVDEMQDMQDMPCHHGAPGREDASKGGSDFCKGTSHCCAHFIPPAAAAVPADRVGAIAIAHRPDLASGIVIPPLDPPPLAL